MKDTMHYYLIDQNGPSMLKWFSCTLGRKFQALDVPAKLGHENSVVYQSPSQYPRKPYVE